MIQMTGYKEVDGDTAHRLKIRLLLIGQMHEDQLGGNTHALFDIDCHGGGKGGSSKDQENP